MENNVEYFEYAIDVKFLDSGEVLTYSFTDESISGAIDQLTAEVTGECEILDVREIVNGLISNMDDEVRNF